MNCRFAQLVAGAPALVVVFVVSCYQALIRPLLSGSCKYWPSCSTYCIQAVSEYGAWRGMGMTVARLFRCHPLAAGGFDPVPRRPRDGGDGAHGRTSSARTEQPVVGGSGAHGRRGGPARTATSRRKTQHRVHGRAPLVLPTEGSRLDRAPLRPVAMPSKPHSDSLVRPGASSIAPGAGLDGPA